MVEHRREMAPGKGESFYVSRHAVLEYFFGLVVLFKDIWGQLHTSQDITSPNTTFFAPHPPLCLCPWVGRRGLAQWPSDGTPVESDSQVHRDLHCAQTTQVKRQPGQARSRHVSWRKLTETESWLRGILHHLMQLCRIWLALRRVAYRAVGERPQHWPS